MADDGMPDNPNNTLPRKGKVQKLKKEFMVHEDAGLAYQLQNEEIDKRIGLNRFHRRRVREDIPIAKIAQSEEEARQQQERFDQLQALTAQAEEDERVAKKIAIELTDEEYAKHVQEEERKKYEKHIDRQKQWQLTKEREEKEKIQQQQSEAARLAIPSGGKYPTPRSAPAGYPAGYQPPPQGRGYPQAQYPQFSYPYHYQQPQGRPTLQYN